MLEAGRPSFAENCIRVTAENGQPLFTQIPGDYHTKILEEVRMYEPEAAPRTPEGEERGIAIKATTYEGAKGLSAQHIFIVGLHEGEIPHDSKRVQDLEICKFIVGLTRTRKKCTFLCTRLAGDRKKRPSRFLGWIRPERYEPIRVDAAYWKRAGTMEN